MEKILGFLLINAYALLVIVSTCVSFFSRKRLHQVEDETYKGFLLANVFMSLSGLMLGIFISPALPFNKQIALLFNKLYLIGLFLWITIFTFYITYISINKGGKAEAIKKIFKIIIYVGIFLIVVLPIDIELSTDGSAIASGLSVIFTYLVFAICFIEEIIMVIYNHKNFKSKKYLPLYLLIILGTVGLVLQVLVPSLNYLINPELIFIAFVMYHTIENPDIKMLEELHRAKEISDSSNEDKTMFLYNMTNEIRGITRDIDRDADDILDETDNKKINIENINNFVRNIKSSTARFTTMTNEILDISQVESNSIKIYNEKYNVKNIIREVYTMYKGKCDKKGIEFRLNIASDIPEYLYGDSVSLKKVLVTITDNAVLYTDRGYVEFRVNVIRKNDLCRLVIVVEDSEDLNRIFMKYGDDEQNNDLKNNLYNAKKLITLIGGAIVPSSNYGKGTTMKIIIDQKIAEEEESNLKKYEKVYDKKNILIVDDNEASGKIFRKIFEESNMNIEIVTSGKECLDKIRNKEKYDLILLDEEMSPLSGIEVMKKLKEIRNFNTDVLLLTKDNSYEYNDEYLKYGFCDYILKPLDKNVIFDKLNKYLNKKIDG